MKQATHRMEVQTRGQGLTEITGEVARWVGQQGLSEGLLTVFIQHTSASLTIQENADPDVRIDLVNPFKTMVPTSPDYIHSSEGPDDMPAHIKSTLTDVQLTIPVTGGRPALGTWQGIYVFEHRDRPHRRRLVLHLLGE